MKALIWCSSLLILKVSNFFKIVNRQFPKVISKISVNLDVLWKARLPAQANSLGFQFIHPLERVDCMRLMKSSYMKHSLSDLLSGQKIQTICQLPILNYKCWLHFSLSHLQSAILPWKCQSYKCYYKCFLNRNSINSLTYVWFSHYCWKCIYFRKPSFTFCSTYTQDCFPIIYYASVVNQLFSQ